MLLRIHCGEPLGFFAHPVDQFFGSRNAEFIAEAEHPAQKVRADGDLNTGAKAVVTLRDDGDFLPEAIKQDTDDLVFPFKGDAHHLTAEHAEKPAGILRGVELAELFLPLPGKIQNGKMHHLVHAVVLDLSVFRVKSNEIVVFVIPHQAPRAYLIPGPVTAKLHFLLHIPPVILKTDLPAAVYGIVQEIDIVVNTLVHGFGTAGNQHLTVKIPRLMHNLADCTESTSSFSSGNSKLRVFR